MSNLITFGQTARAYTCTYRYVHCASAGRIQTSRPSVKVHSRS